MNYGIKDLRGLRQFSHGPMWIINHLNDHAFRTISRLRRLSMVSRPASVSAQKNFYHEGHFDGCQRLKTGNCSIRLHLELVSQMKNFETVLCASHDPSFEIEASEHIKMYQYQLGKRR